MRALRDTFSTFGIPDTLTSDGGPEFASHGTRAFLGVHHRMASVYHPHANCRAEVAVKTMKRLIAGNTGPAGALSDDFHKALLQYRNGPDPTTKISPAACLFGRATRDLIPGLPRRYRPHQEWSDKLELRERALSKRTISGRARWDEHAQGLSPLKCGDTVLVQNQSGRHPTKWDKTGTVVEVLQYHQYAVRTDGSGRLTTRNRRFLRRYDPHLTEPDHPHRTGDPPSQHTQNWPNPNTRHGHDRPAHSTSTLDPEPPSDTAERPCPHRATLRHPTARQGDTNHPHPSDTPLPVPSLPRTPTAVQARCSPPCTTTAAGSQPQSYASVTRTPDTPCTTPAPKRPALPRRLQTTSPPHHPPPTTKQTGPQTPRQIRPLIDRPFSEDLAAFLGKVETIGLSVDSYCINIVYVRPFTQSTLYPLRIHSSCFSYCTHC